LQALIQDAASTWKSIANLGSVRGTGFVYPFRAFHRLASPHGDFFEKTVAAIEAPESLGINITALVASTGQKPMKLPAPEIVRRLRVVTAELPILIRPTANRGIGSDREGLWRLLWLDAMGLTAPKIAKGLQPNFDPDSEPLKRDRIWKLRAKVYKQLASAIAPTIPERKAA